MLLFKEIYYYLRKSCLALLANSIAFFLVLIVSISSKAIITNISDQLAKLANNVNCVQILDQTINEDWFNQLINQYKLTKQAISYSLDYGDFQLTCCTDLTTVFPITMAQGTFFGEHQLEINYPCCVIGAEVYKYYNYPTIDDWININGSEFLLMGLIEEGSSNIYYDFDTSIFVPINFYYPNSSSNYYFITDEEVEQYLASLLPKSSYLYLSQVASKKALNQVLKVSQDVLALIAYFSVIVAYIGLLASSLSNLKLRYREIGIKKAMGANNRQIYLESILNTIAIVVIAEVLAFIYTLITIKLVNALGYQLSLNISECFRQLISILIFGIVISLYPGYRSSKLTINECLRVG